jgi:hypothetical protein
MRVSRGIFRLWVFVTAVWLGGAAVITYLNWPEEGPWLYFQVAEQRKAESRPIPQTENALFKSPEIAADVKIVHAREIEKFVRKMALWGLVPPALLFLGGNGILWVARGFRRG